MSFVANDEVLPFQQLSLEDPKFSTTLMATDNRRLDEMDESTGERMDIDEETSALRSTSVHHEHHEPAARHIEVDENYSEGEENNDSE